MSQLLFPFLLLLYSEWSEKEDARHIARILLYGYSFSIVLFSLLPPTDETILIAGSPFLVTYFYLIYKINDYRVRLSLMVLSILQSLNFLSLYFNSYEIILNIPFYVSYSNVILRESSIFCVLVRTEGWNVDTKLKIFTFGLYLAEYGYLLGD